MSYTSLNPTTGETLKTFTSWDSQRLASALERRTTPSGPGQEQTFLNVRSE